MDLPTSVADELELDGGEGCYRRPIDPFWGMSDRDQGRVFGGYAAATALAAAAREASQPALLSCYVMFLRPTLVEPVEIAVETLRVGHANSAMRATTSQRGRPRVSVEAWFTTTDALEPGPAPGASAQPADACPPAVDWTGEFPFMALFDERAIDYPESLESFPGGPPKIALWMRTRVPLGSPAPVIGQIRDVMALDAHLLDSVVRGLPTLTTAMWSLDLAVWWHSTPDRNGSWFAMTSSALTPRPGFASTTGGVSAADGRLIARAAQYGRVYDLETR